MSKSTPNSKFIIIGCESTSDKTLSLKDCRLLVHSSEDLISMVDALKELRKNNVNTIYNPMFLNGKTENGLDNYINLEA